MGFILEFDVIIYFASQNYWESLFTQLLYIPMGFILEFDVIIYFVAFYLLRFLNYYIGFINYFILI